MSEPKHFACKSCNHTYNKPKTQRAVFSDMTQIKVNVCPKCLKPYQGMENPEWVEWLNEQRERHIQQAIEHNGGKILGVKVGGDTNV